MLQLLQLQVLLGVLVPLFEYGYLGGSRLEKVESHCVILRWLNVEFCPDSGEEPERAIQDLHLPVPAAHRQAQPLLLRQATLRRRDQQRHSWEAHLQPCSGNGTGPPFDQILWYRLSDIITQIMHNRTLLSLTRYSMSEYVRVCLRHACPQMLSVLLESMLIRQMLDFVPIK